VKVVVDTNILVSGIFWGGKPGIILGHWRFGNLEMLATVDILEEYLRVIAKIGKHDPELVEHWTRFLLQNEAQPWCCSCGTGEHHVRNKTRHRAGRATYPKNHSRILG
jgi:hypothetical protein